ncbi:MAG: FMN-binding protein [Pseudomonadota bacterium]
MPKRIVHLLISFLVILPMNSFGTVYYSKLEALELAFGKEADVEMKSIFMTDEQIAEVEKAAKAKLESKLFTFYLGRKNGEVVGYAAIESHTVRTKPETLMIVLSSQGQVTAVHVLAFHEPPEYQPPERWFSQLLGTPREQLQLNRGVDGITGATLSTRSAVQSTRKVLAIYQLTLEKHG